MVAVLSEIRRKHDRVILRIADLNNGNQTLGQVDSTEFAELAESAENHNFLSSLIKQPNNYP